MLIDMMHMPPGRRTRAICCVLKGGYGRYTAGRSDPKTGRDGARGCVYLQTYIYIYQTNTEAETYLLEDLEGLVEVVD